MEAVEAFPPPSTVKELQQFLGLVNFYWRFLPRLAATLKLLTDALQGAKMGADAVQWSSDREEAFLAAKKALAAATRLAHPCQSSELSLAVDASATHVGACLKQRLPRTTVWQPLGFYWKKLDKAQVKYSAFDRELLACYLAIRHFCHMLEGRQFVVYTDHKPLTVLCGGIHQRHSPHQGSQQRGGRGVVLASSVPTSAPGSGGFLSAAPTLHS